MEFPKLWVRSEPFDFALVQSPPSQRLTYQALRKLITAVRSKSHSSDLLSFPLWRSFAVNRLQVAEELAWAYFESYHTLTEQSAACRRQWSEQFTQCRTDEEQDSLHRLVKVSLPKFLLFLVLQMSANMSLRSLSSQDVAPGSRGPPLQSATPKVTEEFLQIQFLLKELPQVLSLLAAPDSFGGGASGLADMSMTDTSVEALAFLLEGTSDGRSVVPLSDIAHLQSQMSLNGYSKITRAFSVAKFQSWVSSLLGTNPYGVDACIAKRRLHIAGNSPLPGPHVRPLVIGKTATNRAYAPKSHRLLLFSQVSGQTLVRDSADVGGCGIIVKRCHHTTIYLLAPLRFVRVERCRGVTLVLGVVQNFVKLSHCQDVKVYTVAQQLHVSDCSDSTLYMSTPCRPLLLYGNRNLTLAPYSTFYPRLQEDMAAVGLTGKLDRWDSPVCSAAATAAAAALVGAGAGTSDCFKLMAPADFYMFAIPFAMHGCGAKVSPLALPPAYGTALAEKESKKVESGKQVESQMRYETVEKKKMFVEATRELFQEWLRENGHQREIDDLATLQRAATDRLED